MENKTEIQFINHASVLVKNGDIKLLSDPWYQGDAFHKGWNLIHELSDEEIINLLDEVTHIWISHEHPDHFSIMFFKKFGNILKEKKIKIIFQKTKDKRVESFLSKSNFELIVIQFNSWIRLSNDFDILTIKDGFYDSGLVIKTNDKVILNLNDCEVKERSRCKEILKIVGECDVLISQFSYAAWKGGIDNIEWRVKAAREKLETLKLQVEYFKPKILIPFASYIYFSNKANFYLNDSSNKPEDVIDEFAKEKVVVNVMQPFETFSGFSGSFSNEKSLSFWDSAFKKIDQNQLKDFDKIEIATLEQSFLQYQKRIFENNSRLFMKTVKFLSPISTFKPIIIRLIDLNVSVLLDIFSEKLNITQLNPDISISSESLNFIMTNTFGFDTLTVNGCLEEESKLGFSRAARLLAIENLNNMGISFKPNVLLNFQLIALFMSRLFAVSRKLKLSEKNGL